MNFDITHDGKTTLQVDRKQALEMGYPESAVDAAEKNALGAKAKLRLRDRIAENAGDVPSLLGTTADAAQMLLVRMAKMTGQLSKASSLAEMRDAAKPFAELTAKMVAQIDKGKIKMPYLIKGEAAVLDEIATRSTAVAETMIDAAEEDQAKD